MAEHRHGAILSGPGPRDDDDASSTAAPAAEQAAVLSPGRATLALELPMPAGPAQRNARRLALSAALALALSTLVPALPAAAASAIPLTTAVSGGGTSATVTLVTGDTVTVTTAADGRTSVAAEPAPGTSATFVTETGPDGDTYVLPDSAGAGLADGRLDRGLFDVTRLIADHQDDAHRDTLPLIVDYAGTPARATLAARAEAAPGVTRQTALASIGATAVAVDKDELRDFSRATLAGPKAVIRPDRAVHAALDVSVPQIGAPAVWKDGYDGTGAKVAVLDTGVDLNHPDLAGRVLDSKSFITGQSVQDGKGHGTHVAGIVAGSGAASDGKYRGVAPGASLLVGKVLDNSGQGDESTVIAGMEWAVGEGADIVSMSLGSDTTEASDPLSQAVDSLSDSSGALFVIAAGNSGPTSGTISSPATARRALTVGAVSKTDQLAGFSGRGPTADGSLKPEITAPGVGIVSARAAGTSLGTPVNASYTSLDGTSMATPHVAGAAALLVQQHPDWTAARLKDSLVSSAKTSDAYGVYQQGAGRLAVDRASEQPVSATGTADFGDLRDEQQTRTRTVTYTNDGDQAETLALHLSLNRGDAVPDGAAALSADTLTVPAHGTAAATLTVDPTLTGTGTGRYDGYLTATGTGVALTTAVGWTEQAPRRTVDFTLTGRDGRAAGQTNLQILDLTTDDTVPHQTTMLGEGTYSTQLPEGRYAIQAIVTTYDDQRYVQAVDQFAEPEFVVDGDRTVHIDARQAHDLTARVDGEDRPLERADLSVTSRRTRPDGASAAIGTASPTGDRTTAFGLIPSHTTAEHGTFDVTAQHRLRDPLLRGTWTAGGRTTALDLLVPDLGRRLDGAKKLTAVDVGAGAEADYTGKDLAGKLAVVHANGWLPPKIATAAQHGAAAVLAVRPTPGATQVQDDGKAALPSAAVGYTQGAPLLAALADGPVTVTLAGREDSRFTYSVPFHASGAVPDRAAAVTSTSQYARLVNTFHADGSARLAEDTLTVRHPWEAASFRSVSRHLAPGTRTDLVYAADSSYAQTVHVSDQTSMDIEELPAAHRAGTTVRHDWGRAPLHPSLPRSLSCPLCRSDAGASFVLAPYGDADPSHFAVGGSTSTLAYSRDGVPQPASSLFVPGAAEYRIDLTVRRNASVLDALAPRVDSSFTFRSQAPADGATAPGCAEVFGADHPCAVLPVILLGYDVPLDGGNAARSGRGLPVTVTTSRPDGYRGARVTGVRVQASYDDGATWTDAVEPQVRSDGSATAVLHQPKTGADGGHVTLRVTAWDSAGDRTEQTVTRAYALHG